GGSDSLGSSRTGASAVDSGGGTATTVGGVAGAGPSGFVAKPSCCCKVRRSFSTDESRESKSSTVRFAAFALAIAKNGSTTIKIKKPTRRRIRSSICLLDLAAYSGFAQDDRRFARRLLIDKNLGIHRRFRS